VSDISPLFALPQWRLVLISGCPWNAAALLYKGGLVFAGSRWCTGMCVTCAAFMGQLWARVASLGVCASKQLLGTLTSQLYVYARVLGLVLVCNRMVQLLWLTCQPPD
jgi:hypothetical protein